MEAVSPQDASKRDRAASLRRLCLAFEGLAEAGDGRDRPATVSDCLMIGSHLYKVAADLMEALSAIESQIDEVLHSFADLDERATILLDEE